MLQISWDTLLAANVPLKDYLEVTAKSLSSEIVTMKPMSVALIDDLVWGKAYEPAITSRNLCGL
jgi:hypothetical protein